MANALAGNPAVIDTAGAAVLFQTNLQIIQFEFIDYALDTDQVTVQDRFGRLLWRANGAADLSPVRSGKIGYVTGLAVPTLSAGKLFIWFE